MDYQIEYACFCGVGKVRRNNQDNFWYLGQYLPEDHEDRLDPGGVADVDAAPVFCVFDGMGGEACGEKASFLCAQTMDRVYQSSGRSDMEALLTDACFQMNDRVVGAARALGIGTMGSTMTGVAFDRNEVTVCNVGDSRIYRYSRGTFQQLSKDHVMEFDAGRKPRLLQFIGVPPEEFRISPTVRKKEVRLGDIYLICSDGVTDMLTPGFILQVLERGYSMEITARLLEKLALKAGGRDNMTGILCRIAEKRGDGE